MALNWPTFFTRLGSAIVFSAIMMTGFLWQISLPFILLIALIMVLCFREYFRLTNIISGAETDKKLVLATIAGALVTYGLYCLPMVLDCGCYKNAWPIMIFLPILLLMWGFLSPKNNWSQGIIAVAGLAYVLLPFMLLNSMRMIHWILPLALLLLIWMNDTMAYLVGSFIGKTPFSKISPKKTWEGTIGGALFTIALAAVWGYFSHLFRIVDWMVLAACASVAGTAGDLLESRIKRMADVKDSGTMMPGHGGALDRFDSLLVATPFAFAYVYVFMQ